MTAPTVSVVIPTCDRGPVLLDTLRQLRALSHRALEVVVVDQSAQLQPPVAAALAEAAGRGELQWIRRARRSIPAAMNHGVRAARGEVILFIDDDVRIHTELVQAHARAHADGTAAIVAGQVIQPWQQPLPDTEPGYPPGREGDPDAFRFNCSVRQEVRRFIGCNVSMRRRALFDLGGFDENFGGAAYRFEADLAERACLRGMVVRFEPVASLHHLKAPRGGTRGFGHHLRTVSPWHSAGRYYYLMLYPRMPGIVRRTAAEAMRSLAAREHLRRPWWIPVSAAAELCGIALAAWVRVRGPRLALARPGAS